MKYSICFCLALGLGVVGCKRDDQSQAGAAAVELGHGTLNAARSVGHGVVCGVREIGQTLSGTQGDPHAEAISAEECRRMNEASQRAGQQLERGGSELRGSVAAPDREVPPHAAGGGPAPRR